MIIDSSQVRPGRLGDLKSAYSELAQFVETHEPRIIAYEIYLDVANTIINVLQVHPDSASAEFHLDLASDAYSNFTQLLSLNKIDVYGSPSEGLLSRLWDKARLLGNAKVIIHTPQTGFARFAHITSGAPE
jgi:hypothetical protein